MARNPETVDECIQRLARETGAPRWFVVEVRKRFSERGVSLDENVAPILEELEKAFCREAGIRAGRLACLEEVADKELEDFCYILFPVQTEDPPEEPLPGKVPGPKETQ